MKVLQINIFGNLSTGRIAADLYRTMKEHGHEGKVAFARNTIDEDVPYIKIGNMLNVYVDGVLTRLTDKAGFYSKSATKKLIGEIKKYNPDIIHLHNLHGYYINVEILFDFLREYNKPVVWTLHDCWAFTGHCCYYSMANCEKWKTECKNCIQSKAYPSSFVDNSKWNYEKKKNLFLSLPKLQLVTVSKWLENEVRQSFLKDVPICTIYNGIDTKKFKPTQSDLRKKYNIEDKKIVLGVASTWDVRKGLDDFIELSKKLDNKYQIVLVGISKKEKTQIPENIITVARTTSVEELAGIYSTADVFFNASVEETFGLPTVESIACGTPAIVYNATALPEVINEKNGVVVEPHDITAVIKAIDEIVEGNMVNTDTMSFSKQICYKGYVDLYVKLCE